MWFSQIIRIQNGKFPKNQWLFSYLIQALFQICMLTSCPWGPATAHGLDMLTELYAIYMESMEKKIGDGCASNPGHTYRRAKCEGPLEVKWFCLSRAVNHKWKTLRKYIWMSLAFQRKCKVLRSAVGKTHALRSDLWWTIPLHILHWSFWDTQKSTISILAVKLSVSAIVYPWWIATQRKRQQYHLHSCATPGPSAQIKDTTAQMHLLDWQDLC